MAEEILRPRDAAKECKIGLTTMYRQIRKGEFPPPRIHLTGKIKAFARSDLEAWIEQQKRKNRSAWKPKSSAKVA